MSKQELTIEIAQINSIEVDDVNFAEAGEDEVFQQLATDAACADKKNARLCVMRELSEYIFTQHHLIAIVIYCPPCGIAPLSAPSGWTSPAPSKR